MKLAISSNNIDHKFELFHLKRPFMDQIFFRRFSGHNLN